MLTCAIWPPAKRRLISAASSTLTPGSCRWSYIAITSVISPTVHCSASTQCDAAYCAGSSFGFLGDSGDAAFLDAVARTLKPGGRFFGDFKAAESVLPSFRESYEMPVGNLVFAAKNSYDPAAGTMENLYTVTRGSEVEKKRAVHRIYTTREILKMLSDVGFAGFETFGSVGGETARRGVVSTHRGD